MTGWGKRGYNWQTSLSVDHQLRPGVALNAGYYRTWFGNFTVVDNLAVTPADYDQFCMTAPIDPRLGSDVSGQQTWLQPTQIMPARLFKLGFQIDF